MSVISSELQISELLDCIPLIEHALYKDFKVLKEMRVLNLTQEKILVKIKDSVDRSMSDIAKSVGLEKGPFSQTVDKLVKLGYIKRIRSEKDRRIVYLSLTEQGNTYATVVISQINDHFNNVLSVLSSEEREVLFKVLTVIQSTAFEVVKKIGGRI